MEWEVCSLRSPAQEKKTATEKKTAALLAVEKESAEAGVSRNCFGCLARVHSGRRVTPLPYASVARKAGGLSE